MKNDKYEFLYNYARSSFEDELRRFKNIEDKANKFISLLSILIVGYTAIIQFSGKLFFPPKNFFECLTLVIVFLSYLALILSWSYLFRSLKFVDMPRLPLDDEFIGQFKDRTLPTNHFTLSKTCKNALSLARQSNIKKTKLLMKAYGIISFSVWALSVSLILLIITSYINEESLNMPETEKKQQAQQQSQRTQTQPEPEPEPDFDATPPKVEMILETAMPKTRTGADNAAIQGALHHTRGKNPA